MYVPPIPFALLWIGDCDQFAQKKFQYGRLKLGSHIATLSHSTYMDTIHVYTVPESRAELTHTDASN